MSTLSSASTLTEITNAYLDKGSYEEDGSTAKAQAFITACRLLILKLPKRTKGAQTELELEPRLIKQEMDGARAWLASKSSGSVTHVDFAGFRD